jgi:hypothetical protein
VDLLYSFSTRCAACRFVVDLLLSPQQINILPCRDVVDLSKSCGFAVDSLWICSGFVVDLLYNSL